MSNFLEQLDLRGLLHQSTGEKKLLQEHLSSGKRVGYIGFDPSRSALTIGNLLQLKILMHWQQDGHIPLILIGGGTGLIGDPSGKDQERKLLDYEKSKANANSQEKIIRRLLDFNCSNPPIIVNNYSWLSELKYIDVLRDIGKYFSINSMLQKDSVRDRLNNREQGISYTEFSYMILQAYDFLYLRKEYDCTVQLAGSDQYGNIVSGIDLIRREFQNKPENYPRGWGITTPLLTDSEGKKIGKTEDGAIWLDPLMTSSYKFYQFWLNQKDKDLRNMLNWFTFLDDKEINDLLEGHEKNPHIRAGQRSLAELVTTLVHGKNECRRAQVASEALFSGDVSSLDKELLQEVCNDVPSSIYDRKEMDDSELLLVDLLAQTSLAKSKREAREFLLNDSISMNGFKITDGDSSLKKKVTCKDLLHESVILLKRGKRSWHVVHFK